MNITYKLNKPASLIFDYLTDMDKFVSIHPVISKMNALGNSNYKVYETLKFGPVPYSFTYPATIIGDVANKSIVMKAVVMKINKISMSFKIIETSGHTLVEEEVLFSSPFPVKSMMQNIFKKQHAIFFKNLDNLNL